MAERLFATFQVRFYEHQRPYLAVFMLTTTVSAVIYY
jgi:hypothetical protein